MAISSRFVVPVLVLVLLLPASLSSTMTVSAEGDLYVTSVVIVQVVPEPRGIVANKSAAICVTVVSTFSEEVHANISVTYNHGLSTYVETGPDGVGVPLSPGNNTVYVPGGNCTARPLNWTSDPAALIWTSPGVDSAVTAEVDTTNSVVETDETNNRRVMTPIDVWAPRSLRILVVPIRNAEYRGMLGSHSFVFSLDEELEELRETYPLADDGIEMVEAPPKYEYYDSTDRTDCGRIALNLSAEARILGYDRVVAVFEIIRDIWGIETYGCAVGSMSEPRDPVPLFISSTGIIEREALLAHELGHTYYLWHPHDIGIDVYGAVKYSVSERQYGVIANTLMTYPDPDLLPADIPVTPRWIDCERYQNHTRSWIDLRSRYSGGPEGIWEWNLYSQLVHTPPTLGPVVVIAGSIVRDGPVHLTRPWFAVPLGLPEEQIMPQQGPVGSHSVRTLDSSRNILGSTYFNVSFTRLVHYEGENDSYVLDEVESVDFVVNAPNMPGTRYVQIVDPNGNVLAEREVSSSVPSVHILSPNGAEVIDIGQSPEISWTAEDIDGDSLSYFVSYTPDGGNSWIPVANNLTANSFIWNTTGIAPTDACRIRVMASDGFNTGEDLSDAVFKTLDSTPPTTTLELVGDLGQNGWYVSNVSASLLASDNSRILKTEYSFDNSTWMVYQSGIPISSEGNNTLSFRSIDLAGNAEPIRSAAVRIDVTAPYLAITSPLDGSSVGKDVVFSWDAMDAVSEITGYEVKLNSGTWTDVGTEQQWEGFDMVKGVNTLEVRATDAAGNNASASVDFSYRESSGMALWTVVLVAVAIVAAVAIIGILYLRKGKG
jgi:hypothetical protein